MTRTRTQRPLQGLKRFRFDNLVAECWFLNESEPGYAGYQGIHKFLRLPSSPSLGKRTETKPLFMRVVCQASHEVAHAG
jgi:hypothetical protein